jgi:hypothetical protein
VIWQTKKKEGQILNIKIYNNNSTQDYSQPTAKTPTARNEYLGCLLLIALR